MKDDVKFGVDSFLVEAFSSDDVLIESPDYNSEGETFDSVPFNVTFILTKHGDIYGETGNKVLHYTLGYWMFDDTRYSQIKFVKHSGDESKIKGDKELRNEMLGSPIKVRNLSTALSGRYFPETEVISFWDTEGKVRKFRNYVDRFISHKNLNQDTLKFECMGGSLLTPEVKSYQQVFEDGERELDRDKITIEDERILALLAKQHVDPLVKKALKDERNSKDEDYYKAPRKKPAFYDNLSKFSEAYEGLKGYLDD